METNEGKPADQVKQILIKMNGRNHAPNEKT